MRRATRLYVPRHRAGFTLLELLLVVVIAGIALGAVALNISGSEARAVHNDAERLAVLMVAARDEAILRNHPVAFEADAKNYRFLVLENDVWKALDQNGLLRQRTFLANTQLSLIPAPTGMPLRIVFGVEPIATPFALTLNSSAQGATIHADGIGNFSVD